MVLEGNRCCGSLYSCSFQLADDLHTTVMCQTLTPYPFWGIVDDHRLSALMRYVHLSLQELHNIITVQPYESTEWVHL